MESEILAGFISFLTASAGLLGAPLDDIQESHDENSRNLELGSAHEHAQFFLNVDEDEKNFTQKRYQLQSSYVHLENFKPYIVHKHSENVTWSMFLNSIDVNVERKNRCVEFKDRKKCGNLSIVLNGEEADLKSEIQQGDNLAILVNSSKLSEQYMKKELPADYTKKPDTKSI